MSKSMRLSPQRVFYKSILTLISKPFQANKSTKWHWLSFPLLTIAGLEDPAMIFSSPSSLKPAAEWYKQAQSLAEKTGYLEPGLRNSPGYR